MTVGEEMMSNRFQGDQAVSLQELLLRKGSEFYFDRLKINLQKFEIEGFYILAESESDAQEIYKIATNQK